MRRAFTLFEVLVALAVFAMAVIGLMVALNSALSAARQIRTEARIRALLESRLATLEGGLIFETERVTESTNPRVKFTESLRREKVVGTGRDVLEGFWRARVVAEWEADGEQRRQEATFLRYSP